MFSNDNIRTSGSTHRIMPDLLFNFEIAEKDVHIDGTEQPEKKLYRRSLNVRTNKSKRKIIYHWDAC